MTTFWLYAGLLCAVALAFILVPQLKSPNKRVEVNRTSLNIGLYEERLRELEIQHNAGMLDAGQLETGRVEVARELLGDIRSPKSTPDFPLGRSIPLISALSTPLLAIALYLHWGSLDQLVLTHQHAGHSAESIGKIVTHLKTLLATRPDSAEGWSLLGRAYMAQDRMADAAHAFEHAATLAGRPPKLLGDWAQALYFAGDRKWTHQLQTLTNEALASDPQEAVSLRLVGMAAFQAGSYAKAAAYWERLAATLPEGDPSRAAITNDITRARELAEAPDTNRP